MDKIAFIYIETATGKCHEARMLEYHSVGYPGFFVTSSYADFKPVVQGKENFLVGVEKGTFKIQGNIVKKMRNAKFIRAIANLFPLLRANISANELVKD